MPYTRVIPRDLFNESKLLKCLGQLSLLIHEGRGIRWPLQLECEEPDTGFQIDLDRERGGLICSNVSLFIAEKDEPAACIEVYSPINSKSPYPLQFVDDEGGEWDVFNDDGLLSTEFAGWLDRMTDTH